MVITLASDKTEDGMKRERALQVVLVLVGLFYSFWGYLLFDALWHSRWLNGHNDVLPMFLSLNTALGPCRQRIRHETRRENSQGESSKQNGICLLKFWRSASLRSAIFLIGLKAGKSGSLG